MATLRSRLSFIMRFPLDSTQSGSSGYKDHAVTLVRDKGDLRITVRPAPMDVLLLAA